MSAPSTRLAQGPGAWTAAHLRTAIAAAARSTPGFPGKVRALRKVDALLRAVDARDVVASVDGARFVLDTTDLIQFMVLYFGAHDRLVRETVDRLVAGVDAVLWDVGANVGSISLPLALRRPPLRVVAFEPAPRVRARLERNLAANGGLDVRYRVLPLALSDRGARVPFFESAEAFNSGVGGLEPSRNRVSEPVTVRCAAGDDLVGSGLVPPPDVLKIDVEGFEPEVVRGLQRTLTARPHVVLVFEHEPYRLRARGLPLTAVLSALGDMGYAVHRVAGAGRVAPLRPSDLELHMDCVAARSQELPLEVVP